MNDLSHVKKLTSSLKVLCVEDNEDLRKSIVNYLEKFFALVVDCKNGLEGLEEYKKGSFDIVLTDINMPVMDGLSMSTQIKKLQPKQHIIIISAYKEIQNYIESIKIGIDGYILKPMDFDQVNSIIFKIALQINHAKQNKEYQENLVKLVEEKTYELKQHYIKDDLTGLYNKKYLEEKLQKIDQKTLLLLNIDNFKIINNNFGFFFGDKVIQNIAQILKKFENNYATLFRLQGDEFVFCIEGKELAKAKSLAEDIRDYFHANVIVQDTVPLHITFSYGIDESSTRDLLLSTSLCIQELKQNSGKNLIGIYQENSKFEETQKHNLIWVEKIRECINGDRLHVMFQPIQNVKTGKIEKFEALSRVISKDGELIMPGDFLNAIVLGGLITKFTKQVIHKAFEQISHTKYKISINITSEDLKEDYLLEYLQLKCDEFKIQSDQVILEVLETISSVNETDSLKQLQMIKKAGFQIAIDDFGSEHSNFGRLLSLDVDIIKIDGSFIKNIHTDYNSQEIVKAITTFSHNIGKTVIAEYVFCKEVYDKIKEFDVDFAQGYYINEPKPTLEI